MPLHIPTSSAPSGSTGSTLRIPQNEPTAAPAEEESSSSGGSGLMKMLGAGALAAGGYAALKNPGALGKIANYANTARQQLMLSGFAPIKSILGNGGAMLAESLESGSMAPLKEFFSGQTVKDAVAAYKSNPAPAQGVNLPGPTPGRFMQSMDIAARNALQRAGYSADDAERLMFQTPLHGKDINGVYDPRWGSIGSALESPAANYVFPFRRTGFNQFLEGMRTVKDMEHPAVLAGYTGAGAVNGATTSDERYPLSIPLGVAASAKYGPAYGAGAIVGRMFAGGKGDGGATGGMLPVSEYGVEEALTDPLSAVKEPAVLRALQKFR